MIQHNTQYWVHNYIKIFLKNPEMYLSDLLLCIININIFSMCIIILFDTFVHLLLLLSLLDV